MRKLGIAAAVLLCLLIPGIALAQAEAERTRVVILGVGHSAQLVEERQRPAALRAFFDRVAPDAIAVERSPEEFARGDHYEFTYEIQYLAIPYAAERGIPLHPIDWLPSKEDMLLGFGVDLESPPEIRRGWRGFLSFPDSAEVRLPLFFADGEADRMLRRAPWQTAWEPASRDLPRRLYLYRTYLQARRILLAAGQHPGGTLLVPIGVNHKDDIESILADHPRIEIMQPSIFGEPTAAEIEAAIRREDLIAIASFNLLGVQASTGNVDWAWMRRVTASLEQDGSTPETRLLATRLAVLTGELAPAAAIDAYRQIQVEAGESMRFTWNGVKDTTRVDSYFDPFGNLWVSERACVEIARELYRQGRADEAMAIRDRLADILPEAKARQLLAYWPKHVAAGRNMTEPCRAFSAPGCGNACGIAHPREEQ